MNNKNTLYTALSLTLALTVLAVAPLAPLVKKAILL
jgi:hypothetical protein